MNAAAKAMGLPQPTLARIADGRVTNPRARALERIASYFDVSTDWLLSGRGRGPREDPRECRPFAELTGWRRALQELELSSEARRVYDDLPGATSGAALWLSQADEEPDVEAVFRESYAASRAAMALELRAWTTLLGELVARFGRERMRTALERHVSRAKLGFSTVGSVLINTGAIAAKDFADVDRRIHDLETAIAEPKDEVAASGFVPAASAAYHDLAGMADLTKAIGDRVSHRRARQKRAR